METKESRISAPNAAVSVVR